MENEKCLTLLSGAPCKLGVAKDTARSGGGSSTKEARSSHLRQLQATAATKASRLSSDLAARLHEHIVASGMTATCLLLMLFAWFARFRSSKLFRRLFRQTER